MNMIEPDAQTEPAEGPQKRFTVYFDSVVSTAVVVQAEDPDQAIDLAYKSPDMPSSMADNAFGRANVVESGDWYPVAVIDHQSGEEVWADR